MTHAVPCAHGKFYHAGDKFLVWRETVVNNRMGGRPGLLLVMACDEGGKLFYVQDIKIGASRPINTAEVRPHFELERLARSLIMELRDHMQRLPSPGESDVYLAEIINDGDPGEHSKEKSEA